MTGPSGKRPTEGKTTMLKLMKEDKEFIFSFIPFLFLFGLTVIGLLKGLVHQDKFLYALLILAFMSPSPYRLYIKIKDWLEMGRNGGPSQPTTPQAVEVTTHNETPDRVEDTDVEDVNKSVDDRVSDKCNGGDTFVEAVKVRVFEDGEVSRRP